MHSTALTHIARRLDYTFGTEAVAILALPSENDRRDAAIVVHTDADGMGAAGMVFNVHTAIFAEGRSMNLPMNDVPEGAAVFFEQGDYGIETLSRAMVAATNRMPYTAAGKSFPVR